MRPILFNTPMVQAILEGRKTVTRRAVKPHIQLLSAPREIVDGLWKPTYQMSGWRKTPCKPGDILYVRETWQYAYQLDENENRIEGSGRYYYAADGDAPGEWLDDDGSYGPWKWRPSIHMPKEAARLFLRVTDVRVERLQGITEEDAEREGSWAEYSREFPGLKEWTAKENFAEIWDSTVDKKDRALYGWAANPWVWVIEFDKINAADAARYEKERRND